MFKYKLYKIQVNISENEEINIGKLKIEGSLDKNTIEILEKILNYLIEEKKYKKIIISLENIKSIDSAGMGFLASIKEEYQQQGIFFKFINIPSNILHIFEILGLTKFFEIYHDNISAIVSFIENKEKKVEFLEKIKRNNNKDIIIEKEISFKIKEDNLENRKKKNFVKKNEKKENDKKVEISSYFISPDEIKEEAKGEEIKKLKTIKIKKVKKKKKETKRRKKEENLRKLDENNEKEIFPNEKKQITISKILIKEGKKVLCIEITFQDNIFMYKPSFFKINISLKGKTIEKNRIWEIIPNFPGCIVSPIYLKISEKRLPAEFHFFVTPITSITNMGEIIFTSLEDNINYYYKIFFNISIKNLFLSKILNISSFIILILSFINENFHLLDLRYNCSLTIFIIKCFLYIFIGNFLIGIMWAFILFLFSSLFYYINLKSQKISQTYYFPLKED